MNFIKYISQFTLSLIFTFTISVFTEPMHLTEFSLMLKPSPLGGIGVFATHDIKKGTMVFDSPFSFRVIKIVEVPEALRHFCIYISDQEAIVPERFDRPEVGWFINHSDDPNIASVQDSSLDIVSCLREQTVYAIKDIKAGEEITIDYNHLHEPEHLKEGYYLPKER